MDRRRALSTLSFLGAAPFILPAALLSACQSEQYVPKFFQKEDMRLLDAIAECILPETEDSPGAKSAKVGNFIDAYTYTCLDVEDQEIIQKGWIAFQQHCQEQTEKAFVKLSDPEKTNLLVGLDAVSKSMEGPDPHYFSLLKQLVLMGYFTSQEGATKALRYQPIPGKYEGDIPYKEGDKAWAI